MSAKTVTAELKPCPFCGSEKLFSHREPTRIYEGMGPAWIRCDGCHCQLTIPEFDKLVIAWNTRAADPKRTSITGLEPIGQEIRTQDNRATDAPIFIVQQKRYIYGMDPAYGAEDKLVWLFDGELETDGDEIDRLNKEYARTGREPGNHTRTSYIQIWEFVTACFTQKGCEEYIRVNGHNLKEPRIYAEGSYRNEEFRKVREALASLQTGETK